MPEVGDACSKCGRSEPEVSFYYRANGKRRKECKLCRQAGNKKWQDAHTEEVIEYQREYRADPEHKEEKRERYQKRYQANREEILAKNAAWKEANREYRLLQERKRYQKNSERIKANSKRWQQENPLRKRYYNHCRRQLLKNGSWTPEEWELIKAMYENTCLCCGRKEPEISLEFDHIIPLSIGGPNTIENCQPLCKSCNSSKSDRIIDYR